MSVFETYTISTDFTAQPADSPRQCKPKALQDEINVVFEAGKQAVGIEVNLNTDLCIIELEDGYDPAGDKASLDAIIAAHLALESIRARIRWDDSNIYLESSDDKVNWFTAATWPHTIP